MSSNRTIKYALVEWDSDCSVSVVPVSRLKSREGKRVTQLWPTGTFAGTILQESGKCIPKTLLHLGLQKDVYEPNCCFAHVI